MLSHMQRWRPNLLRPFVQVLFCFVYFFFYLFIFIYYRSFVLTGKCSSRFDLATRSQVKKSSLAENNLKCVFKYFPAKQSSAIRPEVRLPLWRGQKLHLFCFVFDWICFVSLNLFCLFHFSLNLFCCFISHSICSISDSICSVSHSLCFIWIQSVSQINLFCLLFSLSLLLLQCCPSQSRGRERTADRARTHSNGSSSTGKEKTKRVKIIWFAIAIVVQHDWFDCWLFWMLNSRWLYLDLLWRLNSKWLVHLIVDLVVNNMCLFVRFIGVWFFCWLTNDWFAVVSLDYYSFFPPFFFFFFFVFFFFCRCPILLFFFLAPSRDRCRAGLWGGDGEVSCSLAENNLNAFLKFFSAKQNKNIV
jgi:hypothetical protein